MLIVLSLSLSLSPLSLSHALLKPYLNSLQKHLMLHRMLCSCTRQQLLPGLMMV